MCGWQRRVVQGRHRLPAQLQPEELQALLAHVACNLHVVRSVLDLRLPNGNPLAGGNARDDVRADCVNKQDSAKHQAHHSENGTHSQCVYVLGSLAIDVSGKLGIYSGHLASHEGSRHLR